MKSSGKKAPPPKEEVPFEYPGGIKHWRNKKGRLHRVDKPAIESESGKEWWNDGYRHRLDGPAIENSNGYKAWWINGLRHRVDGPAIEWSDRSEEWYINGVMYYTKQEWFEALTEKEKLVYLFNMEG